MSRKMANWLYGICNEIKLNISPLRKAKKKKSKATKRALQAKVGSISIYLCNFLIVEFIELIIVINTSLRLAEESWRYRSMPFAASRGPTVSDRQFNKQISIIGARHQCLGWAIPMEIYTEIKWRRICL